MRAASDVFPAEHSRCRAGEEVAPTHSTPSM